MVILVLGALGVIVRTAPDLGLVPRDIPLYFESTYLNLIFSAYAGILASFVAWRVGGQAGGRYLAVLLSCVSMYMALSVVPAGGAVLWRRSLFVLCHAGANIQGLLFWSNFPREMSLTGLEELASRPGTGGLARLNRVTARLVSFVLRTWRGKAAFGAGALTFALWMAWPGTFEYNIMVSSTRMSGALAPPLAVIALTVILVAVAFAWSSFRLADEKGRRTLLWVILAHVWLAAWLLMDVTANLLASFTSSGLMDAIAWFFQQTTHSAAWFVILTGFALAVFFGGAFDLRPLISKTTLYGASLVTLTVVFALVEEGVENQLATRLGMPDGLGTWVGAGVVALVLGPVRTKFDSLVKRVGDALEPNGGAGETTA